MDLQISHHNKLEDDAHPICTNSDFTRHKTEPRDMRLDIPSDLNKLSSQPDNNESYVTPRLYKFISEQDLRKEILLWWSSFLVSTIVFLGFFYNIWSCLSTLFGGCLSCVVKIDDTLQKHIHRLSIWPSLLTLFGFLVFVCSVAVMILVGGVFSSMQKAVLISWLVLMHLQSANSILEVCVILLAGLFMAWYTFWKKESQSDERDFKSSNILMSCQLKQ